jgi:hypothetical protein
MQHALAARCVARVLVAVDVPPCAQLHVPAGTRGAVPRAPSISPPVIVRSSYIRLPVSVHAGRPALPCMPDIAQTRTMAGPRGHPRACTRVQWGRLRHAPRWRGGSQALRTHSLPPASTTLCTRCFTPLLQQHNTAQRGSTRVGGQVGHREVQAVPVRACAMQVPSLTVRERGRTARKPTCANPASCSPMAPYVFQSAATIFPSWKATAW